MSELWLDITDIPATGREFSFSDPAIWTGPIAEFGMAHRLEGTGAPLAATFPSPRRGGGSLFGAGSTARS